MIGRLTVGPRRADICSMCGGVLVCREIRFNVAGGTPMPCYWVMLCDDCWRRDEKMEARSDQFLGLRSGTPHTA